MANLKEVLTRIVKEMDDEEVKEEFEALRNRKVTWAEVREAIAEAPPEERAQLRELLREEGVDPAGNGGGDDPPKKKEKPAPKDPPEVPPADEGKPKRNVRPGRKSGMAYGWYVDDDGRVQRSPTAVIYSGEDEPDEVEMLPEPEEEEEEVDE